MSARALRCAVIGVAAAGAMVITPLGPAAPSVAHASTPIRFATPTVVDATNIYGEPDLRNDPARPDQWYASGPWGTGVQRSIWNRSTDGAHTFREMHDHPDPVHTGGSLLPPGGGDTEIAQDRSGKLYLADLAALQTQKAYTSNDGGKTFTSQVLPPVFQDNNGTDRQWINVWDPPNPAAVQSAYHGPFPVAYMTYLAAGLAGTLGGETIGSSVPNGADSSRVGLDYACAPGAMGAAQCPHWALNGDGYTAVDQLTGKVVQAIATVDTNTHDHIAVEVMTPGANGYMASAKQQDIADLGHQNVGSIFPTIAMDAQRNLYAVWIAQPDADTDYITGTSWQVFYAWSPPGPNNDWSTWSKPHRISSAPMNTGVMPWAVAGGNGVLDVAWYGTTSSLRSFNSESDPAVASASWYLYFAQVQAADTSAPQPVQTLVTDTPMHHGSICLAGLGCITQTGNRNLADFFEITADHNGAAYIVYNNTANDLIQQVPVVEVGVPEGVVDHRGAEVVMVARQVAGPGLLGADINQPDDHGVNGLTSPSGDALYDPITGTEQTGLDIVGTSLTLNGGNLEAAIQVVDPSQTGSNLAANAIPVGDFVVRWEYKSTLYFAEVEVPAGVGSAAPVFFDGRVQSVDLCSVSACDPHITVYPGPTVAPLSSHMTTGRIVNPGAATAGHAATPGAIVIDVPLADVGSPRAGDHLDSVGAYSLVSSTSALLPIPNALAQADIVPVEVDGACCFTPVLGRSSAPNPVPLPPGAIPPAAGQGNGNPNTAGGPAVLGAAPAIDVLAVLAGAGALRRRRRRRASG